MKKSVRMVILLLVLVVLLGAVFGLRKQNNNGNDTEVATETEITVLDVKKEDVVRISYDYEGENYSFEKQDGIWYSTPDTSLEVTQMFINSMAGIVAPLRAQQVLENVTNMSQYGLEKDVRTIHFETAEASYDLEVGSYNAVADVYYMRKASDTTVYVVSSITVAAFDKELEDVIKTTEEAAE